MGVGVGGVGGMADRELAAGLLRVDRRLAGIEHRLGLRLQAAGYPALAAAGGAPLPPSAADPAGSEGAAVSPKKSIPWYADFLGGVVGGALLASHAEQFGLRS